MQSFTARMHLLMPARTFRLGIRWWSFLNNVIYTISVPSRSSAIAEGLRDASCQLKFANCHATVQKLLVRQVLKKSKLWSWRVTVGQCVINMCTQPWHDESLSLSYRCQTNRPRSSCGYHLYTDDLLWRNFLSPQCRNCSRDPDHAHLGNTDSSQD